MKILKFKYQRNGVSGIGFFSCLFEATEYSKEMQNCEPTFLATFEGTGDCDNDRISIPSVRVENLSRLDLDWRGDTIGYALQKALDEYCDKLGIPHRLTDAAFPKYLQQKK